MPRNRAPWVIAAAAVVFGIAMLVVVLARPGAEPDRGPGLTLPVADALSPAPATTPPATAATPARPATTTPRPATTKATFTTPPRTGPAVASRIVAPRTGSGVARDFTVKFTVSAADLATTGTRLALTVCVKQWCFLDGPLVLKGGAAEDYTVTLGTGKGEGVGEKWTVRVDRLTQSTYDFLQAHKQAAVDDGSWGNGVTTPIDRLNKTPVSAVVLTKTS